MNFEDLAIVDDTTDNVGGTTSVIYIVDINDVDTEATPDPAATTLAGTVTVDGNHTLVTGKRFFELECELDAGELMSKVTGDRGGKSLKSELDVQFSRFNEKTLGFIKYGNNKRLMVIAKLPDGKMVQLGSKMFPAEMTGEGGTGKNASGVRATKLKFESMANSVFFYEGTIDLT
jgi:hypothetical protein